MTHQNGSVYVLELQVNIKEVKLDSTSNVNTDTTNWRIVAILNSVLIMRTSFIFGITRVLR